MKPNRKEIGKIKEEFIRLITSKGYVGGIYPNNTHNTYTRQDRERRIVITDEVFKYQKANGTGAWGGWIQTESIKWEDVPKERDRIERMLKGGDV